MALLLAAVLAASAYLLAAGYIARRMHPTQYADQVSVSADEFGVPRSVIFAVIKTESSFRPDVVSTAGAVGLMQITPDTFDWLQFKSGEKYNAAELYKPEVNIRYGTMLLAALYDEFGRWDTAYAAYNAGLNRVRMWLSNPEYSDGIGLKNIPFGETDRYVKKVEKAVLEYKRLYKLD